MKNAKLWIVWAALSLAMVAGLVSTGLGFEKVNDAKDPLKAHAQGMLSPAALTPGHAQIGQQCTACHEDKPFYAAVSDEKCVSCHARNDDNKAESTHPKSKFEDPANADRLAVLAADKCVTCHAEHQPGANPHVGVTQPKDFCVACHKDVAKDAPSHDGMAFDTCTNAGCHSYHDNRATYRKLLKKNVGKGDPEQKLVSIRDLGAVYASQGLENPHGTGKVGECKTCHEAESKSFSQGKHGVRLAAGLSPMSPDRSNLAFGKAAHGKELTCTTCHDADRPDTKKAAVEVCQSCHADDHTKAYTGSKHADLWKKEVAGEGPEGSGVSCATCHMPRAQDDEAGRVVVSHDQTGNLRPVIKQAKVCTACHSLQFTHDALADRDLAGKRNFTGKPSAHVKSIDMEAARK